MTARSNGRTLDSRTLHRVLFVPGLFQRRFRQSGRIVADLLAKRLAMPAISAAPDLLLDDGGRCARYVVSPASDNCSWHPVEIVEVNYDDVIRERDRGRSLIHRAFVGISTLVVEMPRLRSLLLHNSMFPRLPRLTCRQVKWALKYATSYLAFTSISLFLLAQIAGGAWQHLSQAFDWTSDLASGEGASGVESQGQLVGWVAVFAVLATLLRMFVSKGLQETIEDDASSAFAFVDCQKPESKLRRALVARLDSAIAACFGDLRSSELSIVSYSAGALLAIDSLFPTDSVQTTRDFPDLQVRLFLTFGCPLNVVTRLWPNRRGDQVAPRATIKKWKNVFETHDQLGGALFGSTRREGTKSAVVVCVGTEVDDYEFTRRTADGPWDSPHVAYWSEAERNDCELLQGIVDTLTGVDTAKAR